MSQFSLQKSVVLLSSGLDSTVNLYESARASTVVLALTFDYGQRAAQREIQNAARLCQKLGVAHQVLELPWFKNFTQTSLINRGHHLPVGDELQIDDLGASSVSAKAVWVPNRNGIFLNIAAAFAEGLAAQWVVPGFNAEEAATFPDNTGEFLDALAVSFRFSTATQVEPKCFTTHMQKTEIAQRAVALGADFADMWPCYEGGETPCGRCESCQRFERATRGLWKRETL